ncbi:hypothetical protein VKT23_002873 [Stygiomarasmius scandens]|uniref:HNH nuclease domain-containing protein n=1 Tax=Marasmiellus scandens TaxID=2682957 RepID=A0ABR1JWY9_9AGAR
MVTHKLDQDSIDSIGDLKKFVDEIWPDDPSTTTECAHIFPQSTNNGTSCTAATELHKLDNAASFWTILERFGFPGISHELDGNKVHQLGNVMTLDHSIHHLMDKLSLWFEPAPDGIPYHYNIVTSDTAFKRLGVPRDITFSADLSIHKVLNPDLDVAESDLPLPNPNYLHIHATACKVAHMSGAADYIDLIFRDMEVDVLAEDGTSADLLAGALSLYAALPPCVAFTPCVVASERP